MLDYAQARRTMVDCQIRTADVTDRALLAAMDEVPREIFMPANSADFAYSDRNIELPASGNEPRCMLNPVLLARMIQALGINAGDKVLDVAGGLGYGATVLARLGASVTCLENTHELVHGARECSHRAGVSGAIDLRCGSLDGGAPDVAPFDAIIVNGTIEQRPDALLDQLAPGGRLVCLERNGAAGHAQLYVKSGQAIGKRQLFDGSAPVLPEFRTLPEFSF